VWLTLLWSAHAPGCALYGNLLLEGCDLVIEAGALLLDFGAAQVEFQCCSQGAQQVQLRSDA
jgi:hypothetical protein